MKTKNLGTSWEEIEKAVREKAGAIAKELEGNPSPKEKISKDEEK